MVPRGGGSALDPALRWEGGGWGATPADIPGVELKLGALGVLLSSTLLFGFLPLCVVRRAGGLSLDPERQKRWLSLVSCFAGGVFLATCLLDLLPDYLEGMEQAFGTTGLKSHFPLPEFIMAMGFFLVLVLEQVVLSFKDREPAHPSEEHRSLLVDSSIQSHEPNGRRHSHSHQGGEEGGGGHFHVDFTSRSALRAFILVFSLSLHSVFEGLAVGLLEDRAKVLEICVALLLHKSIISFSLSLKLVQARLRRPVVAGCVLLFAAMSPLGIGLGLALTETQASPQHLLARSTLEGMATGTFLYITFLEILPHELSSPRDRLPKVGMLLLGFSVVTAVLFIQL
ncbi:hypothetical protein NHX12_001560 [Muraenolepis orangiensis]|uniref:Zinc transporter ZIP1 n=1 Tax=Muraenolepis orangiensis TaxID=630683 RepID=A0A9Q0II97_9TELE|nr:hypothetical protein NHX12_001560 [Muraenolepis orangiensis]